MQTLCLLDVGLTPWEQHKLWNENFVQMDGYFTPPSVLRKSPYILAVDANLVYDQIPSRFTPFVS